MLFSYTIFKQIPAGTRNKNKIWKRPFLTKDIIFINFPPWPFQAKMLAGGNFYNFLFLPVPARWNPHCQCLFFTVLDLFIHGVLVSVVSVLSSQGRKRKFFMLFYLLLSYRFNIYGLVFFRALTPRKTIVLFTPLQRYVEMLKSRTFT